MSYDPNNWKSGDLITAEKLNNIEEGVAGNAAAAESAATAATNAATQANLAAEEANLAAEKAAENAVKIQSNLEKIEENFEEDQRFKDSTDSEIVQLKLVNAIQSAKIEYLEDKSDATHEELTSSMSYPDEDISTNGALTASAKTVINAKSVVADKIVSDSAVVNITAAENVTVNKYTSTGSTNKSVLGNAQININTNGKVTYTDSTIGQTGYNNIEVGLSNSAPTEVLINNVDFGAALSNNAISIHNTADNAVVTISNCHFADVSNPLRISNIGNVKLTINVVNCTVDKWEENLDYTGFVLFQDFSSKTPEEVVANNRFSPDKVTINFVNTYGPNGKIVGAEDLSTILGSGDLNQIAYVYADKVGIVAYSPDRYPTFTFA